MNQVSPQVEATLDPFAVTLSHMVYGGAVVIHVVSYEWERLRAIAAVMTLWQANQQDTTPVPLNIWSQSTGLLACNDRGEVSAKKPDLTDPIDLFQTIHTSKGGVWLLEDVGPFIQPNQHQTIRWLREIARKPPRKTIVILSAPFGEIPPDLAKEVPSVSLPLPGADILRMVLHEVAQDMNLTVAANSEHALVTAARGLTVMEAYRAFGQAASKGSRRSLTEDDVPLVSQAKEASIRQSGTLECVHTDLRLADVGGIDQLKLWLHRQAQAFTPEAQEFGLTPPKGLLLLGVQGCGKSLLAKAVAASWQLPLLRLDVGKVFGGLVGQSEGNIREALRMVTAIAPCVLWIDEIEKGISGMGSSDRSDGGTTARVVGTLLTWMQEKTEPVFVIATANSVRALPPELLRKGRFDDIFFVDLPTTTARVDILRIHLTKVRRDPATINLPMVAERTQGFSGAELEEVVRQGLALAYMEGRVDLRTDHLLSAAVETRPMSQTMAEEIHHLRTWAQHNTRPAASAEPAPTLTSN